MVLGLGVLLGVGACASGAGRTGQTSASDTPLPVADVGSVAGRWAGLMDLPGGGSRRDDQYVEVSVQPDGTYQAKSARTIGLLDAKGTVVARDGRLWMQGEQGARGTGTLVSRDGGRVLMIDMTGPDGGRITARLRPQP
jgi:hypothetical protein